jgi:lambda repressor-like predicted transcriptional regulator
MLRQLKPREVDEMVQAYEAGSTPNELATRFRVHRTTVTANLRRRGVVIRETVPRLRREDVDEAAALYRGGWSLSQLGAKFRVSSPTMSQALRKVGVTVRPPGGQSSHSSRQRPDTAELT